MQARDMMSRDILTVQEKAALSEAASLIVRHRISGLPVLDEADRLVGIITERDLILRHWTVRLVEDVMTRDVITVSESAPVSEISTLLIENNIKRVIVMNGSHVAGVVSRVDVIRAEFAQETDHSESERA